MCFVCISVGISDHFCRQLFLSSNYCKSNIFIIKLSTKCRYIEENVEAVEGYRQNLKKDFFLRDEQQFITLTDARRAIMGYI